MERFMAKVGIRRGTMQWIACLAACTLCGSCGSQFPVAPVSGTITYQGKPLVDATVTTQPIATDSVNPGPGSFGKTDAQGHYELELVKPAKKGAILGDHRVMISCPTNAPADRTPPPFGDDPNAHRQVDRRWPASFSDGSLQLHVPRQGRADANFDL